MQRKTTCVGPSRLFRSSMQPFCIADTNRLVSKKPRGPNVSHNEPNMSHNQPNPSHDHPMRDPIQTG